MTARHHETSTTGGRGRATDAIHVETVFLGAVVLACEVVAADTNPAQ